MLSTRPKQQVPAPNTGESSELASRIQTLDVIADRLEAAAWRAKAIVGRLVGTEPTAVAESKALSPSPCHLAALGAAADRFTAIGDAIESQLGMLDKAL